MPRSFFLAPRTMEPFPHNLQCLINKLVNWLLVNLKSPSRWILPTNIRWKNSISTQRPKYCYSPVNTNLIRKSQLGPNYYYMPKKLKKQSLIRKFRLF